MECRRWRIDTVEVPRSGRDVNSRTVSHTVLVNPNFVFVSGKPRRITLYRSSFNKQCWRCCLIMNLYVEAVLSGRHGEFARHAKLQFSVEHQVEVALGGDGYRFLPVEVHLCRKFHSRVVAVLFPERREHSSTLRSTVVELIAEPHLEVARIPYPCCFIFRFLFHNVPL